MATVGLTVSTVQVRVTGADTLPALSTASAPNEWDPSERGPHGERRQAVVVGGAVLRTLEGAARFVAGQGEGGGLGVGQGGRAAGHGDGGGHGVLDPGPALGGRDVAGPVHCLGGE